MENERKSKVRKPGKTYLTSQSWLFKTFFFHRKDMVLPDTAPTAYNFVEPSENYVGTARGGLTAPKIAK